MREEGEGKGEGEQRYNIRVIDFEDFKRKGSFPRYSHKLNPQDTEVPEIVKSFYDIDFSDSLKIED